MATDGLSKKIGSWGALNTNVKARLPQVPQLEPTVKDLDEVIVEGRELQGLQDVHRRQLRETTQRCREVERRGRKLRNQLIVGVQSVFGVDNMVLVEFGIEPRLPQKRTHLTPDEKVEQLRVKLKTAEEAAAKAAALKAAAGPQG
jgi:hypothetical protein